MINAIDWINDKYDIDTEHKAIINVDFDYEDENVVAIIGESGTGKTTLLRKWFETKDVNFTVSNDKSIFELIVDKGLDYESTSKLLFDVGLSSVPMWKNTYNQISNGEKLRFEIAYKLVSDDEVIYIDEYTSMLDRQTAENLSINLNELLDKFGKKIVFTTCHFDVLDWIKVDKVVDTTSKKSLSLQTPELITHMNWKSEVYQETCGEYLVTITI